MSIQRKEVRFSGVMKLDVANNELNIALNYASACFFNMIFELI